MATTPNATPTAPATEKLVLTRKFFNLKTLKTDKVEKEGSFTAPADFAAALQMADGKQETIMEYVVSGLRRAAKIDGRKTIEATEDQVPIGLVRLFTKNFLPMFSNLPKKQAQAKAEAFVFGSSDLTNAFKVWVKAIQESGATVEEDDGDENDGEE